MSQKYFALTNSVSKLKQKYKYLFIGIFQIKLHESVNTKYVTDRRDNFSKIDTLGA